MDILSKGVFYIYKKIVLSIVELNFERKCEDKWDFFNSIAQAIETTCPKIIFKDSTCPNFWC